ncbi:tlde1 domain-containing protein [Halopseudomonas pelagia]|uniref:tlde1 domain-containing protein n=1 Tax=Halopseudomonas pelagia TaxID=553151 RepID=UPI0030D8A653|tara:strand:+ start:1067 stop:1627 length:561 start_codon:yes stop_codon:yes gene_type:complete
MNDTDSIQYDGETYLQIAELTTTDSNDTSAVAVTTDHNVRMLFHISEKKLFIVTPSFSMTMEATSGTGDCLNNSSLECQKKAWEGPLPVGDYTINPAELSDPGLLQGLYRNMRHGDWGDWRVRLHPKSEDASTLYGRDGFFMHGGSLPGSAGCIDIGGGLLGSRQTNMMKTIVRMSSQTILVEVRE